MVNKVILIGNLGRDPEVRSTPSGQPNAKFTLATNRKWRDKNGQKQEQTEWHNIVVWGKQAEIAGQYLTKGKQIYLEGRIQTRSWDDRNTGEKKYMTEIICDNFQMLGQRGGDFESHGQDRGGYSAPASQPGSSGPSYDEGGGGFGEPEEDDIPF
ncbi:MAG TPA: single-stranded DNA-binding protein [Thermoanaerobaculia bacterium]|jgi:single-strand DNA-binding protein